MSIIAGTATPVSSVAFAEDQDLSGSYLANRENAVLSPADQFLQSLESEEREQVSQKASLNIGSTVGNVLSDVVGGIIETPRQILGGVRDAAQETIELAGSLGDWLNENVLDLGDLSDVGIGKPGEEPVLPDVDEPRTTTGGIVRGMSQFLAGFAGGMKALKGIKPATAVGKVTKVGAAGAIADATVFDPHEERLSDLIQQFPALDNPVTAFLEAKPEDPEALGRFKNAIEGFGLGVLTDGAILAMRGMRANRIAKAEQRQLINDRATAEKLSSSTDLEPGKPDIEAEFIPFQEAAAKEAPEFKVGSKKAGEERAANINLNNIDSTEDVDNLINRVAEVDAPKINEERRQIITQEETVKLADDLGMSVDELLNRRRGQAFNAEQAVAARRILVASGENLFSLSKKAATGSDQDVALFRRALSQHSAIQSQVSGLTAEAGRALQSFRIQAKTAKAQEQAIKDALEAGGGIEFSKDLASRFSQYESMSQLSAGIKLAEKATTKDMLYEAWINGLLSAPSTHVVNVLSNSIVAAWSVGERKVASLIGDAFGGQSIPEGETAAQLKGMVEGTKDGFRLAWQALKTGDPSDPLQKIENQAFKSITGENLGLTGTAGRAADYLGEAVRVPGRFLTAGDELFKTMGYRMELNSQAFRTAHNEGLRGDALANRMADIIANPPENLSIAAVDAGRYQTFTRELGEAGKAIGQVRSKVPGARIIIPFLRTPVNIVKYAAERTPLAPLMASVRGEIAAGGARADMALAKISLGSMVMAASADYALSGDITGAGPKNPQMRNILRTTGWQPYSIRVGDKYLSYNRLDPIGALIGLSADIAEINGQIEEVDAFDLATASVAAIFNNLTSKTYLSGVAEFFNAASSISSDPGSENKAIRRWLQRFAGSVIPSGVAAVERTFSPELSATYGIIDKIKSRLPGYSEDLPPRRNIFGEPIVLQGGLGPDIMSPIYTSFDKKDPIADEIVDQQTLLRMPRRVINQQELTPEQYDRYIILYSGQDNKFVKKVPLKKQLDKMFRSSQYKKQTEGQEGGKSLMIRSIFEGYRKAAQAQLKKEFPELQDAIDISKMDKIRALTGR